MVDTGIAASTIGMIAGAVGGALLLLVGIIIIAIVCFNRNKHDNIGNTIYCLCFLIFDFKKIDLKVVCVLEQNKVTTPVSKEEEEQNCNNVSIM
jgi:hypothetical protein